jgi:serine/threonine protein phosphatase PrpC
MLCTDGVFKTLAEPDLAALLATGMPAREIIDRAVALGARDNVTVVLVGGPLA